MKKNILITGATSGIGYQLSIDYLEAGHCVYAVGRNKIVLDKLATLGAKTIVVDLTDRQQVIDTFQEVYQLDLVVCAAGFCQYIDMVDKDACNNNQKLTFNSAVMMDVINSNMGTLLHTIEGVLPQLQQSQGQLVAIGSASAYVPFPRAEAYGSSKSAIHYLLKTLRISLQPHGIKVCLVVPGFVDTPMTAQNDFTMPFLQTVKHASVEIRTGIANNQELIEFPKKLTLPLKILGLLPDKVWQKVARRLYKS